MNNRQKAKHFKKLYEQLSKQQIKPMIVSEKNLTTFTVKQMIPNEVITSSMLCADAETPMSKVCKSMAKSLAAEILSKIEFHATPSCVPDHTDFEGKIYFYENKRP